MGKELHVQFIEGLTDYKQAFDYQGNLVELRRDGRIDDSLIFLQHPPVFTFGVDCEKGEGSKDKNVYWDRVPGYYTPNQRAGMVFDTDRRGKGTHHGPGQLVGYVIADIKENRINPITYLGILEDAIVAFLLDYGITTRAMHAINHQEAKKHPGVIYQTKKIAAIGPAFIPFGDKIITKHGFALNVTNDVDYFKGINPCGDPHGEAVSMSGILGCNYFDFMEIAKRITIYITSPMGWASVRENSKELEGILQSVRS